MSGFLVLLVLEGFIVKEILSQVPSPHRSYQWTPPIYESQKPTYTYHPEQNPPLTYSYSKSPTFSTPTGVAPLESVKSYPEPIQYPAYPKVYTPSASPAAEGPPVTTSYAPLPYPKPPPTQTITFSTDVQSKPQYTYPKPSNLIPLPQVPSPMTAPTITTTPKPAAVSQKTSEGLDSTVLNNLAIALQLLILSNILKSPTDTTESVSLPPVEETVSSFVERFTPTSDYSKPYYYSKPFEGFVSGKALPNANFLGSSNVLSPSSSIMSSYSPSSPSRSSYTLMSPYEALSPEPVPSYGSVGSFSSDFQSPYAFSDYGRDVFSFGDIF